MNVEIVRLLSKIAGSDNKIREHRINAAHPVVRILFAIFLIFLCALSRNALFTVSVITGEVLRLAMLDASSIVRCLKSTFFATVFAAVFMLPALLLGASSSFGTMVMKVFESVLLLCLLNEALSWKEITASLGACHVPGIFIFTLDTTVRFLVILGRYAGKITEAVALRQVGEKDWKNAGTGGIAGTTFLKSQQMAQNTQEAMSCRCWDGEYHGSAFEEQAGGKSLFWDLLYVIFALLCVIWFFMTQRLV